MGENMIIIELLNLKDDIKYRLQKDIFYLNIISCQN